MAKKNPYGQIKPGVIKAPNSNPEQPKAKAINERVSECSAVAIRAERSAQNIPRQVGQRNIRPLQISNLIIQEKEKSKLIESNTGNIKNIKETISGSYIVEGGKNAKNK